MRYYVVIDYVFKTCCAIVCSRASTLASRAPTSSSHPRGVPDSAISADHVLTMQLHTSIAAHVDIGIQYSQSALIVAAV